MADWPQWNLCSEWEGTTGSTQVPTGTSRVDHHTFVRDLAFDF